MGITIKELRDKTGLSQRQFAEHFEIPLSTLRKWEQGESKPAPYVLKMLAEKIPTDSASSKKIVCSDGTCYYYDALVGTLSDSLGETIKIHMNLEGVKEENLPLYVKELFESYYVILESFNQDCEIDRQSDIIWG